jgi:uncharacterized membrane protein YuzA (DUF378 family)
MLALRNIAAALVVIGGINWGLVGFFQFNLVAAIFGGDAAVLSRITYALVGLSAIYLGFTYPWGRQKSIQQEEPSKRVA